MLFRSSIIAILASMLLPALNKSRDKAKSIKCVSNMKQWGTAVQLYADDNASFIPPALWQIQTKSIMPYLSLTPQSEASSTVTAWDGTTMTMSQAGIRLKPSVFFCPGITKASASPYWNSAATEREFYATNYAPTVQCHVPTSEFDRGGWYIEASSKPIPTRKMNRLNPRVLFMGEQNYVTSNTQYNRVTGISEQGNSVTQYPAYNPDFQLHGNSTNMLCLGGNVRTYPYTGALLSTRWIPNF